MTVDDLITQALREVGVIRHSQTPTAAQQSRSLTKLNQFMADLFADGVDIGYFSVSSATEDLPVDDEDEYAIRMNFALAVGNEFAAPISEWLFREAKRTKARLERNVVDPGEADMCHVPGGSGSRYDINQDN